MSYSAITYTDKVENGGTTADGLVSSANLNEIKASVNFNGADADSRLGVLELSNASSAIVVKQASDLSGLLSNVVYFIDGIIDMGSQSIERSCSWPVIDRIYVRRIPAHIVCGSLHHFTSPVGGSGNLLGKDLAFETSGSGSQVFDLVSAMALMHLSLLALTSTTDVTWNRRQLPPR